ncbi:MAG: hypothetical protein ABF317_03575 [Bacteroidia bacterium]
MMAESKYHINFALQSTFKMSHERHIEDLKEIRSLMEKSTRFLSLSGWSGIMAGVYALIGAYLFNLPHTEISGLFEIIVIGAAVMAASLVTGAILTYIKAKKNNETMFSTSAVRMLVHIGFPMVVGALFCLAMVLDGDTKFTAGILLIFYGLGLINGSKYTLNDIRVLGVVNVLLGVLALFLTHYGLYFWATGFGLGHIVYGAYMWLRYER